MFKATHRVLFSHQVMSSLKAHGLHHTRPPCPSLISTESVMRPIYVILWASLVAQTVKHLSTMWETQVRSLGREDPLEKEMATHSSTLAWKIPWTEESGGLQSMGSQRVDCATSFSLSCHPLSSPSPPALSLSQHWGLFQ